jgi:ankyrin repeat protein
MNKAIQLLKIYKKTTMYEFDFKKFYEEINQIGLTVIRDEDSPRIEQMIRINQGVTKKYSHEFKNECTWFIIETMETSDKNKPTITKQRKVAEIKFNYYSEYNAIYKHKLILIDSNVWEIIIDGGDGNNFKCMEIDGYYITDDGIYTDIDFEYYMDFVTTDGALFTSVKLSNNLMIDSIRHAVLEGDVKRIETLVKEGKDINEKDERGRTSLMIAAQRLDFKMIKVLLQLGADKNITDNEGKMALDYLNSMEKYVSEKKRPMFEEIKQLISQ